MKKTTDTAVTAENKKKKGRGKRVFLRVLAVFFAVLFAFIGVTAILTVIGLNANLKKAASFPPAAGGSSLTLNNYADGCWDIHKDGDIKVLQVTDIHLGGGWMSRGKDAMALNAVAAMVKAENPDLVIATGDIAYPVPFQAGTFNNKSGARLFAELMETLGVYWTVSLGNHDTEAYSYFSREKISDFYQNSGFKYCLYQAGPEEVDGYGNQVFNLLNRDGVITRTLFAVDSHAYVDGDILGIQWKYDNLHDNQIQWYEDTLKSLTARNEQTVKALPAYKAAAYDGVSPQPPSTLFLHIPLTEYKDAWTQYTDNGNRDTDEVKYNYGIAGETGKIVYSGIGEDEMFETMLRLGSTDTVFCGHDHLNNFSLDYKGIYLTYGMSVDYLAYPGISKRGAHRGCTVMDIGYDGSIDFRAENYYQDKYVSFYPKEEVSMD